MGLLDINFDDPQTQQFLQIGLGILAGNQSGNAAMGAMRGLQNAQEMANARQRQKYLEQQQQMQQDEFNMQKSEYERKLKQQEEQAATLQGLQQAVAGTPTFRPYADPSKAVTNSVDQNLVNSYLAKIDPAGYAKNLMEKQQQERLLGSISPMLGGSPDWKGIARTAAVGAVSGMPGASTLMQYATAIKPNIADDIAAQRMFDETGRWPPGYQPPQATISQPQAEGKVTVNGNFSPEELRVIAQQSIPSAQSSLTPRQQRDLAAKNADPSEQLSRQKAELDIQAAKAKADRDATEATKQTPENAGKIAMQQQAITDIQEARKIIFAPNGQIRKAVLFQSELPGGGVNEESRMLASKIENAIAAKLRLETGAAAPVEEVRNIAKRFMPTIFDSKKSAADKLDRLENYFNTSLGQTKGVETPKSSMGSGGWSAKLKGQ